MPVLTEDIVVCKASGELLWDSELTSYGEKVYTEGDCWALAWHVSQLLRQDGLEGHIYTLGNWKNWGHVVVKLDEDEYLDATGVHDVASLQHEWMGNSLHVVPEHAMKSVGTFQAYLDTDFDEFPSGHLEANKVAVKLIDTYVAWR